MFRSFSDCKKTQSVHVASDYITTVGSDYDSVVHKWKADAVSELESISESNVSFTVNKAA